MDDVGQLWQNGFPGTVASTTRPPELYRNPKELLSRSLSASVLEAPKVTVRDAVSELELEELEAVEVGGSNFSFVPSTTSQLVMERIMSRSQSHSQEMSPLTSGRPSTSSGPLNGGQSCGSLSDSPPVSPSDVDDAKFLRGSNTVKPQHRSKTVGRWIKDRRERKKEEARAHNAELHAAISVAAVAAAVAAIAAGTAAASGFSAKDGDRAAKTDLAVASATTLVAAQCVEAAEAMGAEREHLAAVVSSAVNVRTPGDVTTLTAAAATALRGAATLKARVLKEVWNIAAVIPVEKGCVGNGHIHRHSQQRKNSNSSVADGELSSGELVPEEENFLGVCSQELLARGTELLKRTRKGALHWKIVSVYIHRTGIVKIKMKSRHVAGTITKKKKSVVAGVCKEVAAWPGRQLLVGGEQRWYFGLTTAEGRVIEFECGSQREHKMWTQGVSRLLSIVAEKKRRPPTPSRR